MVELHPAIPHSADLSDIDDATEHDATPHQFLPTSKSCKSKKYKSKKTKTSSKSRPKYNTLHIKKAAGNSQDTANSSSNSSCSVDTIPTQSSKRRGSHQFEPGYKQWKGQNSIFCSGRIIAGPETAKQIRSFFLILVPMGIYFATTGIILWTEYHMPWAVLICLFFLIICILLFFIVSCIDPGIIPRPQVYEKCVESTDVINSISRDLVQPPWEQCINVGGNIRTLKYCYTCHHFRGPRSFHCANCNVCIERFDHHCPWLGNCIAARNYHFYILFLLTINAMCIWVGWSSLYILLKRADSKYAPLAPSDTFMSLWKYDTWPMVTLCFAVIGVLFPLVLLSFHCYLIATNQTTNEKAKNAFDFVSPYSRGCLGNILELCCIITSIPQSNVHIRHQPPNKTDNEAIVNKRKIVYISSEDTKHTISNNLNANRLATDKVSAAAEKQNLLPQNIHKHAHTRGDDGGRNDVEEEEEEEEEVQIHEDEKDELMMDSMNDSSMDNNDPTPSSTEMESSRSTNNNMPIQRYPPPHTHTHAHHTHTAPKPADVRSNRHLEPLQFDRTHHSHFEYNIKRVKPKHKSKKKIVHENIGSNSSLDDGPQHASYTTNLNAGGSRLKRKRNNNKVSRSQSGYSATYKRHKKRANKYIMDSRSNPSVRHEHSSRDAPPRSMRSEQIYYGGAAYIDTMNGNGSPGSSGFHPAYDKYMRKQQQHNTNTKEFAFSPLSPVNSPKELNGGVPPHYPSPHNYHNNNNNTATPILSTNEDNRTLTSTFSFGANGNPMHHSTTHTHKKHLHHQYKGTNSHNTLFSPDISSGYLDNEHTQSSSDYYTTITAPSHAQTYHPHPAAHAHHNGNPFGRNAGANHNGEHSHRDHRYNSHHHHKKHRGKSYKTPNYNVNDILELSTTSNRHKNYWPNRADRYMD